MNKKLVFLTLIFMLVISNCRAPQISTIPETKGEKYKSVRIRVRTVTEKGKEKTKILLGFNNSGDRLIFLGPMNQVLFEILVRGNQSKVIVPRRKQYWEGEFRDFLLKWWNIDLTYNEIKALLLEQRVSRKKLDKSGFHMQIIESEKKKYPVRINLSGSDLRLEFRIYEVKEKSGRLLLRKELKDYSEVSLEKMIRSNPE
ncbi:MAG: hypothetical protein ABFR36_03340 [Acidobacteriota bacterium]